MANANFRLCLDSVPLTTSPALSLCAIACNLVEFTGDVDWSWASNSDGPWRVVSALARELVIPLAGAPGSFQPPRFEKDEPVAWVKGSQAGVLYRKFIA